MTLRAALQRLDALPGGVTALRRRADHLMAGCERATSYAELVCLYGQLQEVNAELATAGRPDPDRDRRLAGIRDRIHAAAPSSDLARMIVGSDFGSTPLREAY